ncbi:MAG TPA: imidazole glycerol phosphate synthase subunit HisH [Cytophagales bacterium]|jgi:imidazole glycerol-phosphate synthase subunit HisH|nr:imidazole glycerol phosphate synthase subunit HisH [Cytophagales bacterium]
MKLSIIKYNAGNIRSVAFALERLGVNFEITDDHEKIRSADKVIFPGVGEASSTMKYLEEKKLDKLIVGLEQPVLGICLGMQLMCRFSEENATPCLGIFDETVKKFDSIANEKIPHMGWNSLTQTKNWLSKELENQYVYFVHSYYVPQNPFTSAVTEYIIPFSSAMRKNNFYAVQFHPEKSAKAGAIVLENFLKNS